MVNGIDRIAIGCDHGGFDRKEEIFVWLKALGYEVSDFGCFDHSSMDYPDVAFPLSEAVAEGRFDRGILICTTGIGMSIAANKVKGIRCSLCSDPYSAEMTRRHNDANVLALSAKLLTFEKTKEIIHIWLHTGFDGALPENERHRRRVQKITEFENR
ncbi:MAG: ribose 5-phosphate isomerase B [bacterium]|nr:ribose 5-phosphate isomerase B [bacterium]